MSPVKVQKNSQLFALRRKQAGFQLGENKQLPVNVYHHFRDRVNPMATKSLTRPLCSFITVSNEFHVHWKQDENSVGWRCAAKRHQQYCKNQRGKVQTELANSKNSNIKIQIMSFSSALVKLCSLLICSPFPGSKLQQAPSIIRPDRGTIVSLENWIVGFMCCRPSRSKRGITLINRS